MKNPPFLVILVLVLPTALTACASGDDETLTEPIVATASAGRLEPLAKLPSLTRAQCSEAGGTVVSDYGSLRKACKRDGFNGDVCLVPNPAYDPTCPDGSSPVPVVCEPRYITSCIR